MAELPQNVIEARNAAQQAQQVAGQVGAMEPTISDVLRQKITEAYSNNQDIVQPLDVATQGYLGAPQEAREKYQNVFNPFSRERLVSQYTGNKSLPMLSLSNIYGNRVGRIEDTIGAGTRAFQADVAAKQAAAQQAQQFYSSLLNEYSMTQQLSQQQETQNLAREKWNYEVANSGVGSSGGGGGGIPMPTESKPVVNMLGKDKNVNWHSPGGQWVYDFESNDWVPDLSALI